MHQPSFRDAELAEVVHGAIERLRVRLMRHAPRLAAEFTTWTEQLSLTGKAEDYYLHNRAVLLIVPRLLEKGCLGREADPDPEFQADLAYSTLSGYYFVRLLDNVTDRHGEMELRLLPLAGFLHGEFLRVYTRHFSPNSGFWEFFDSTWIAQADATVEASSLREWTAGDFERITTRKCGGGKIPVAAVCFRYDKLSLLSAWCALFDAFACWSQMADDLFDWVRDSAGGISTYFLSEAQRRKHRDESAARWVLREGLSWGYAQVEQHMRHTWALAEEVGGDTLLCYLAFLREQIAGLWSQIESQLAPLERLATVLDRE
jgi:hypothetical protein